MLVAVGLVGGVRRKKVMGCGVANRLPAYTMAGHALDSPLKAG